jgi:hypothetical protein
MSDSLPRAGGAGKRAPAGGRFTRKRLASLKPSPENESLYDRNDSDIEEFAGRLRGAKSIEPLVITADNYIVSGHRRHAALTLLGRVWVGCVVLRVRRERMRTDEYIALLRRHNDQRHKSVVEQVRESLVDVDPGQAHARLQAARVKSVYGAELNGVHFVDIEGEKRRYEISEEKSEHVKHVLEVIEGRREYWPLSVRGVHYPLLNSDFVRGYYWPKRTDPDFGQGARTLRYRNDLESYKATSELLTRLRLNGTVPWEALSDPTRPVREFRAFSNVREFVKQDLERLFVGYWRNLLQSQPNHVECLVEKNTVFHMAIRVTTRYQVPTRSLRGFNGIDSLHDIAEAYRASGKKRLVVIVLSDYDPEGELFPHDLGRRLRDDFGIEEEDIAVVKAGVTHDQVEEYELPEGNFAKETSPNLDWFLARNGGDERVWELEALEPQNMLDDLDRVIRAVLDVGLFNREVQAERAEAAYLQALAERTREALQGVGGE